MNRALGLLLGFVAVCALGSALVAPGTRIDYGRWRVVVLQSDDWGLEGWVPDSAAADALPELAESTPPGLGGYARSTLESAQDLVAIGELLLAHRDLDLLSPILQANTIVAAVDSTEPRGAATPPDYGFALRLPGSQPGPYERRDLWSAVLAAEARGIWRAELHGLTHLDLELLRSRVDAGDPLHRRARGFGVVQAEGLGRAAELGHPDPERERAVVAAAVERFRELFDRAPVSVIAPDYRWNAFSEAAWREQGLRVVQGKSDQRDPSLRGAGPTMRLRKRLRAVMDRRRGDLLYLDRCAELEPYGDASLGAPQGAEQALRSIERAWAAGQPAIVSIHRLQLVHLDENFSAAGRAQLAALFELLAEEGGARYLVDAELEQLERDGCSRLRRGTEWVLRNFTASPRAFQLPDREQPLVIRPGTIRVKVLDRIAGNHGDESGGM